MDEKEDTELVAGAQNRAAISAYLAQNPGEHSVAEVAEALGINRSTVGQHLASMSKGRGKLATVRKEGTAKMYQSTSPAPLDSSAWRSSARRKKRAVTAAKDVELVVGGTLIVLGRNPDTGRLRITLEDVS
jgi:DNA-binding transcriptional ArsR family regulator